MTFFPNGYEGLDIDALVALLAKYTISAVVDIRELPLSRIRGFSKKVLGNTPNLHGHDDVQMAALGCSKPVRYDYRDDGNWRRYTKVGIPGYRDQRFRSIVTGHSGPS